MFGKIKKVLFAQAVLAVTTVLAPGTACAKIDPYALNGIVRSSGVSFSRRNC